MLKEIQIEEKEILKRKQLQEVKLLSKLTNSDYIIKCVDIFYGVTDLVKSSTKQNEHYAPTASFKNI